MKHRFAIAAIVVLLAAAVSLSAFGLNYNASKSNTGNVILAHTSSVSEAQAAAVLARIDESRRAPSAAALRGYLTAAGVKHDSMTILIEQDQGKTVILLLDDRGDEQKARDAAKQAGPRSNTQHN
jgi:type IV secretory pathway protease TraF